MALCKLLSVRGQPVFSHSEPPFESFLITGTQRSEAIFVLFVAEKDLTGTKMLTGTATEASGRNLARESGNGANSASREKHATRDRAKENGIENDPNVTSPRKGKERGREKRTNPKMAIEEVAAEIVHRIDGKGGNPGIRKIVPLR